MADIPAHIRLRLNALGRASRPLGEPRARALARELADTLLCQLRSNANAERILDIYEARLAAELSGADQAGRPRQRPKALRDVLQKFSATDVA